MKNGVSIFMNLISSFWSYFLNFFVYVFLLCALFRAKRTRSFSLCVFAALLCATVIQIALEYYILRFFSYHVIALSILAIYIALGLLFFRENLLFCLYYALFMSVLTPCLNFMITNIVVSLYPIPSALIIRVLLPPLLLFFSCLWMIRCCKNYPFSFPLPTGYWVMMYATAFLEYYCLIKINDLLTFNELVTSSAIIVQFFFFLMFLLVYRFIINMCQNYQDTLTEHAAIQQLSLREETYNENRQIFEQMRTLRHELKNHMFYMDYLIDQKRYDDLHEYFMDFYQKEYGDYGYWDTSSSPVNTLLNQRQLVAKKHQIQMNIDSSLPEKSGIREVDLCTILANLLDNAIESCQTLENSRIHVQLSQKKDYLSIIVSNSSKGDVLVNNPSLFTTKSSHHLHGIGLSVVRKLVQKYDGILQFSGKDNLFTVKILLRDTERKIEKENVNEMQKNDAEIKKEAKCFDSHSSL